MAKPIQVDFPVRDHKAELQMRLAEAPTEHAAAILELLDLLDTLHQRNVLTTLRGPHHARFWRDGVPGAQSARGKSWLATWLTPPPSRSRFARCAT
jgi:hypothetical protein